MVKRAFDQVARPSQSGSDFVRICLMKTAKSKSLLIRDIRENGLYKKLKPKSQKVLIQTEELRRSDSLWDEVRPVTPD